MSIARDNENKDIFEQLYKRLEEDSEMRKKIFNLFKEYAKDEVIVLVLEELKKQREDFNERSKAADRRFEELIDNMKRRFEESNKRYEQLRDDMNRRFEAVDKRFEELITTMNKRFEESNKRYEELREDMNRRFEAVDKRFEELIATMNKRFEEVQEQFRKVFRRLDILSEAFGHDFEEFNSYWLETFLVKQGYPRIEIKKKTFYDPDYEVFTHSKNVEVDLFNEDPLVIGEVTAIVREIDKINTFLRKVRFLEKRFGPAKYKLFITYAVLPEIRDEAITLLEKANIDIIILRKGREMTMSSE